MVWAPFKSKSNPAAASVAERSRMVSVSWDRDGAHFRPDPMVGDWLSSPMEHEAASELILLLRQLEEEGFVDLLNDGACLSWPNYYALLESPEHSGARRLLGLPEQQAWRPSLSSNGSLTDTDFAVGIQGWLAPDGRRPSGKPPTSAGTGSATAGCRSRGSATR